MLLCHHTNFRFFVGGASERVTPNSRYLRYCSNSADKYPHI